MEWFRNYWRSLSPAWKAFNVSFLVLLLFFSWLLLDPVYAVLAAVVWSGVIAGAVRIFTKTRRPPWER
jgi:hypothetical protein